jgi:addiction module RelE/StbE family toxin
MQIGYHKSFQKQVIKLQPAQKKRLQEALKLFETDPANTSLYNHSLTGKWNGYRSIAFGGDWRAHFVVDEQGVTFVAVGTHSQLYK